MVQQQLPYRYLQPSPYFITVATTVKTLALLQHRSEARKCVFLSVPAFYQVSSRPHQSLNIDMEAKTKVPKLTDEDLDFLAAHNNCDRGQLKIHFDNFIAKHPNGKIGRKDFHQIMKSCFPSKDYASLEKRIFNMYDENRDGHISFREFMVALFIMSNGTPEANLRQIFRVFDVNGDGSITRKEMKKIVKEIYHLLSDCSEMNKKALTDSAFKEMDANNDGLVSEDEFIQAIMGHEKVASMLALKIVEVFDPEHGK